MAVPERTLLLAAHTTSASTTSSRPIGVLRIASQVFCICMREKAEYSASKRRAVHRAVANGTRGQKGDVRRPVDLRQQRAEPISEPEHVQHRIGQIAEHRRDGKLAPDQEVAAPDVEKARAQTRRHEKFGVPHISRADPGRSVSRTHPRDWRVDASSAGSSPLPSVASTRSSSRV